MKQFFILLKKGVLYIPLSILFVMLSTSTTLNAKPKKPAVTLTCKSDNSQIILMFKGDNITIDRGNGKSIKVNADGSSNNLWKKGSTLKIYGNLTSLETKMTDIVSADFSNATNLTSLTIDNESDVKLPTLDLSKNAKLETLTIMGIGVKTLKLPNSNSLSTLDISLNPMLKSVDLSKLTNLTKFDCSDTGITSLDFSNNKALQLVYIMDLTISKEAMDKIVETLPNAEGSMLILGMNGNVGHITCTKSQVAALKAKNWFPITLDDEGNPAMYEGSEDTPAKPKPPVADKRPVSTFTTGLKAGDNFKFALQPNNDDDRISIDLGDGNKVDLTSDDKSGDEVTKMVKGGTIKIYGDIYSLTCQNDKIKTAKVTGENLATLLLDNNELTSIDLKGLSALEDFEASNNMLTSISNLPSSVTYLLVSNNKFTSLDIANPSNIETLDISGNMLTGLDASKYTNLSKLTIYNNNLKGEALDKIIEKLVAGDEYAPKYLVVVSDAKDESNICTVKQVQAAKAKHWNIAIHQGDLDNPYEGMVEKETRAFFTFNTGLKAGDMIHLALSPNKSSDVVSVDLGDGNKVDLTSDQTSGNEFTLAVKGSMIKVYGDLYNLICKNDKIKSIAVDGSFDNLSELNLSNNELTSVDLQGLTNLETFEAENNMLTSIANVPASSIYTLNLANNKFTALDLASDNLGTLRVNGNMLSSLNLSKLTSLSEVYVYGNGLKGAEMDKFVASLNDNDSFKTLIVVSDATDESNVCTMKQVKAADARHWSVAQYRTSDGQNVPYEGMVEKDTRAFITFETGLKAGDDVHFTIDPNKSSDVISVDLGDGNKVDLTSDQMSGNEFTLKAKGSMIKVYGDLYSLKCNNDKIKSVAFDGNFDTLEELNLSNNELTSVDLKALTNLQTFEAESNMLTSISNLPSNVYSLNIANNKFKSLDLSSENLYTLRVNGNMLSSLNLSKLTALTEVYVYSNGLKGAEMDKFIASLNDEDTYKTLIVVSDAADESNVCTMKQVKAADARHWGVAQYRTSDGQNVPYEGMVEKDTRAFITFETGLKAGDMVHFAIQPNSNNDVISVDLGDGNKVDLTKDQLKGKDFTLEAKGSMIKLYGDLFSLFCNNDKIKSIGFDGDFSHINELNLSNNELTSIDLQALTKLQTFEAENNMLSSVSNIASDIYTLNLANNKFTTLDLAFNSLYNLRLNGNMLSTLDLSKLPELSELYVYGNGLKGKAMDDFIASLNDTNTLKTLVVVSDAKDESNVCTKAQVEAAQARHWGVYQFILSKSRKAPYKGLSDKTAINSVDKAGVRLYPNPVVDRLFIQGSKSGSLYAIYNLSGGLVVKANLDGYARAEVDFSTLPSGVYLLELEGNTFKVIKK